MQNTGGLQGTCWLRGGCADHRRWHGSRPQGISKSFGNCRRWGAADPCRCSRPLCGRCLRRGHGCRVLRRRSGALRLPQLLPAVSIICCMHWHTAHANSTPKIVRTADRRTGSTVTTQAARQHRARTSTCSMHSAGRPERGRQSAGWPARARAAAPQTAARSSAESRGTRAGERSQTHHPSHACQTNDMQVLIAMRCISWPPAGNTPALGYNQNMRF